MIFRESTAFGLAFATLFLGAGLMQSRTRVHSFLRRICHSFRSFLADLNRPAYIIQAQDTNQADFLVHSGAHGVAKP